MKQEKSNVSVLEFVKVPISFSISFSVKAAHVSNGHIVFLCSLNHKDFRNYQYTLPVVQGLVVDMEVRKTSIKIPSNRYNEVKNIV